MDFLGMGGCYEYRIVYDVEGDLHRVIYRFIALAFDSSPIKGEGVMRLFWTSWGTLPPCGYCLEASMTRLGGWFVLFTLTPPCGFPPTRE